MSETVATSQTILVVGGGISGLTAALEAADCGRDVILAEQGPAVGGRVAQLHRYHPKLCPPACGLEILLRRLRTHRRVRLLTLATVERIEGRPGDYRVAVRIAPRYVNDRCTACGRCAEAVTTEFPDPHHHGLKPRRGAYLPFPMAHPQRYMLDPRIVGTEEGVRARDACPVDAVDLDMTEEAVDLHVGALVWATGWAPYDAGRIQEYGYGRIPDVITSLEMERLLDPQGPTGGRLLRPSDGAAARDVAFVQCAGSRDARHLRHCSRVCCMASLKQATYVREQHGDAGRATLYYQDIMALGRDEGFYAQVRRAGAAQLVRARVAAIRRGRTGAGAVLQGVDTDGYHRFSNPHDLVVLAVGMEPSLPGGALPAALAPTPGAEPGADPAAAGIFPAGAAADTLDVSRSVQHATAAALRAVQVVSRAAGVEG